MITSDKVTILKQNRATDEKAWIESRKNYIGSSEIPVILGLDTRFRTLSDLYDEKVEGKKQEPESDYAFFGKQVESVIQGLYQRQNPNIFVRPNGDSFISSDYPFAIITPDSFVGSLDADGVDEILECKSTVAYHDEFKSGNCPRGFVTQLMFQMGCLGFEKGTVATLLSGNPILEKHSFDFNKELFDLIIERASDFAKAIEKKQPPTPAFSDTKAIDRLLTIEKEKSFELKDAESIELVKELILLQDERKGFDKNSEVLKDREKEIQNQIKLRSENASIIIVPVASDTNYQIKLTKVEVGEKVTKGYSFVKFSIKEIK